MPISTEALGLAGEYVVAAEFCRRNMYCQLTLGNRKKTDLILEANHQFYRVSVKTKQNRSWAKVTGIWEEHDLLVFVDYAGKADESLPDFYILDVPAWKSALKNIKRRGKDPRAKIDNHNTLVWPPTPGKKNGWKGCEVLVKDIEKLAIPWRKFDSR